MGYLKKEECLRLSNINREVDSDGELLTKVQTNILESKKINVPSTETNSTLKPDIINKLSSEINSSSLSVEEGKDSAATELIPTKENPLTSESSLAKIHNPVEESIEKESLINFQTDNTEHILSEVQTNKLDSEKMDVPSSSINSANTSVEEGQDSAATE